MAADGRRRGASLIAALRAAPRRFHLLAAVRALEAVGATRVRFRAPLTPAFPPGDVEAVVERPGEDPVIETAAITLFGPGGPLPDPLAEAVRDRARASDAGPRAFFDLFGDRLARAFVDLLRLERPAAAATPPERTPQAQALRALAGRADIATDAPGFDRALLAAAGLLHERPLGLHAAGRVLALVLGVPARVQGLAGGWTALAEGDRTRLSARGGARLGAAALGSRVWLQEGRVILHLGPMSAQAFGDLLPGGPRHALLRTLAAHVAPPEADIDCRLTVTAAERPGAALGSARLGWSGWLAGCPAADGAATIRLRGAA